MSEDGLEKVFSGESQPEPYLDIPTIHEARKRLFGMIFAREVEIRQLEDPDFAIEEPETLDGLLEATRELGEMRPQYHEERKRREVEFTAYENVSNMIDELENDAIKQQEQDNWS